MILIGMLAERCEVLKRAARYGRVEAQQERDIGERARLELVNGDKAKVRFAYLDPDRESLPLVVYPGDTLTQARLLYASPTHCAGLLSLRDHGWDVRPNFHFGFSSLGLTRTMSTLSTDDYVAYWVARIEQVGTLRREDWNDQIRRLIADGVMTEVGNAQFTADFRNTRRNSATVRPGLLATRRWPHRAVGDADFEYELQTTLRQVLDALGESTAVLDGPG